jgi:25S rRNA (uracil2634-N3)-methyltransferase
MARKHAARTASSPAADPPTPTVDAPPSHLTLRSLENLYVHADTLDCVLKNRCVPCGYKIVLHARPGLLPNQRPELCMRIRAEAKKDASAANASLAGHGTRARQELKAAASIAKAEAQGNQDKPCRIGLYDETHVARLLTVGDGNFSFSLALARVFALAKTRRVELVVTSHESRASVVETYPDGEAILQELATMDHVSVHHGVDATDATQMTSLGTFDRVLWNFPCVRVPRGKDGQNEEMELNKALLDGFFQHIPSLLTPTGEVHVTHKTKPPFSQWGMEEIAARHGLRHAQSVVFDRCLYPGYSNKKVLSKGSFPIWDSQTFVFLPRSRGEEAQPQNVEALQPMTQELLAKTYLMLTPTYQEKLDQEDRLRKMHEKRANATGKKDTPTPAKPSKKRSAGENAASVGGKKRKQPAPLAHQKNKHHKGKRQRR